MAPGAGAPGGGVPGGGVPGWAGAAGPSSDGDTVVRGSPLPPDISAVLASGGVSVSSSPSRSCGANTVAGSGTERSSPESALVSVPAQGVPPAGPPGTPAPPPAPAAPLAPASGHPAAPLCAAGAAG